MKLDSMTMERFSAYLRERMRVPGHRACLSGWWVSRYLEAFGERCDLTPDMRRTLFVASLRRSGRWEEWQLERADLAVQWYEGMEDRQVAA